MYLTRSEYDRGVTTFSPEGRLFQVEYALEAVKLGSTAVGIRTSQGVVIAVEKRITSSLMEPSSIEKIMEVDSHIGVAMSGITGGTCCGMHLEHPSYDSCYGVLLVSIIDARTLVEHARIEAQNHRFTYDEVIKCYLC
jgi:20S proteasome subunit alpha 5